MRRWYLNILVASGEVISNLLATGDSCVCGRGQDNSRVSNSGALSYYGSSDLDFRQKRTILSGENGNPAKDNLDSSGSKRVG